MEKKIENRGLFSVVGYQTKKSDISLAPALITVIDSEIEAEILKLAEKGLTPVTIATTLAVDIDAIITHQKTYPLFSKKYAQARNEGLEHLADSLIDISNNEPDVLRARVKSENIKWLLSKRKAAVYGDKLEMSVNTTVDIQSALDEAKARASTIKISKELADLLS